MPSQTRRALEDYDNQHDFERMALHDAWYLGKQLMQQIIQRGVLCVDVTFLVELASLSEATVSLVSTVDPKDPVLRTFKIARTPADGLAYAAALTQDLELDALFRAMAVGDKYLLEVAQKAVLTSLEEPAAILYRQHILADCLERPEIVRQMYANAVEAIEGEKKIWGCTTQRQYPETTLHRAVEALKLFVGLLKRLRHIADEQGAIFRSEGFTAPFGTLAKELDDEYLSIVADHLRRLAFRDGILMSAELGQGNKGTHYVLRRPLNTKQSWMERLQSLVERLPLRDRSRYVYQVADRDESGFRALEELRCRGISPVASALAEYTDHILSFFGMLRLELGFYVGCLNLREQLAQKGEPICLPEPLSLGKAALSSRGQIDVPVKYWRCPIDDEVWHVRAG